MKDSDVNEKCDQWPSQLFERWVFSVTSAVNFLPSFQLITSPSDFINLRPSFSGDTSIAAVRRIFRTWNHEKRPQPSFWLFPTLLVKKPFSSKWNLQSVIWMSVRNRLFLRYIQSFPHTNPQGSDLQCTCVSFARGSASSSLMNSAIYCVTGKSQEANGQPGNTNHIRESGWKQSARSQECPSHHCYPTIVIKKVCTCTMVTC